MNNDNGWGIYGFKLFVAIYSKLINDVENIEKNHPKSFRNHPKFKLLKSVHKSIFSYVPSNPESSEFFQGNTLGIEYRHWKRVKRQLPPRYRMFFRHLSSFSIKGKEPRKSIIFAWLNDELTLRKTGSKTDCYNVFKTLLKSGRVPDNWNELFAASKEMPSPN